mmetsp:Transcript_18247/g.46047  ORF Transcript_18247/g.46047 Transcript_18247/m.46047 type:complete len:347 (+) Transcript_18247:527-1567(+)
MAVAGVAACKGGVPMLTRLSLDGVMVCDVGRATTTGGAYEPLFCDAPPAEAGRLASLVARCSLLPRLLGLVALSAGTALAPAEEELGEVGAGEADRRGPGLRRPCDTGTGLVTEGGAVPELWRDGRRNAACVCSSACACISSTLGRSAGSAAMVSLMKERAAGDSLGNAAMCRVGCEDVMPAATSLASPRLDTKGGWPVSMAYTSTPTPHASAAVPYCGPAALAVSGSASTGTFFFSAGLLRAGQRSTSGAMKSKVPARVDARSSFRSMDSPKSASLSVRWRSNRMLPGLMSRCTMPCACMCVSALSSGRSTSFTAIFSGSLPPWRTIWLSRLPPSANSCTSTMWL